jgi:hypothetical protein
MFSGDGTLDGNFSLFELLSIFSSCFVLDLVVLDGMDGMDGTLLTVMVLLP